MRSRLFCLLLLATVTGFFVSCISNNPDRKNERKEKTASNAINIAAKKIGQLKEEEIHKIGEAAYAVGFALSLETNASPPVRVAQDINKRTLSLSGMPNADRVVELEEMVRNLTSELEKERGKGQTQMRAFDRTITQLQKESEASKDKYEAEVDKYRKLAESTAVQADFFKAELSEYRAWWGLGGIMKGIKQFVLSSLLAIMIFCAAYFVLRILAATSPIAASIFSIFEVIGSWFISLIGLVAPKAISIAGNVPDKEHDLCYDTLATLVDSVQHAKDKGWSLNEFLKDLRLSVEQSDLIDEIKRELKWK